MATGLSLHVGINRTDQVFGMEVLGGCVNDAEAMFEIASANGFWAGKLLDEQATFDHVKEAIEWAASVLGPGDIFLFTFAGHGTRRSINVIEPGNDEIEDQTILLHDCVLVDNYLRRNLWTKFNDGVRVLGVMDSCHSGSVFTGVTPQPVNSSILESILNAGPGGIGTTAAEATGAGVAVAVEAHAEIATGVAASPQIVSPAVRGLTDAQLANIETLRPEIHQKIRDSLKPANTPLNAKVLSLAACQDNEDAADGPDHGKFTQALLDIWNGGAFKKDYRVFIDQINAKVNSASQHPTLRPQPPDELFVTQRPFTV